MLGSWDLCPRLLPVVAIATGALADAATGRSARSTFWGAGGCCNGQECPFYWWGEGLVFLGAWKNPGEISPRLFDEFTEVGS